MDDLSWDASQLIANISIHSQKNDFEAGFSMSRLNPSVLSQLQQLQKADTDPSYSSGGKESDMVRTAATTSEMMKVITNTNLPQQAQTLPFTAENGPYSVISPIISNFVPDFNMGPQQQQLVSGSQSDKPTCSFESLDCLLSAANGNNTDPPVEDDEISIILSDCRNLRNFNHGSTAVSSGESESNARNKDLDETVSQATSDPYISQGKSIEFKANCTKRSKVDACDPYFSVYQNPCASTDGGFKLILENPPKSKKLRWVKRSCPSNINFQQPNSSLLPSSIEEPDPEAIAQTKEMIYRAAAFRPVNLGLEVVEKPERKNVKISTDPQTVAARQRRKRFSERIRVLQKLVPGGSKMDTTSMLDEAANYLKFLRSQVKALESIGNKLETMNMNYPSTSSIAFSFNPSFPMQSYFPVPNPSHVQHAQS